MLPNPQCQYLSLAIMKPKAVFNTHPVTNSRLTSPSYVSLGELASPSVLQVPKRIS